MSTQTQTNEDVTDRNRTVTFTLPQSNERLSATLQNDSLIVEGSAIEVVGQSERHVTVSTPSIVYGELR